MSLVESVFIASMFSIKRAAELIISTTLSIIIVKSNITFQLSFLFLLLVFSIHFQGPQFSFPVD